MNRILLADDSPHAQRMGERILSEEGYEVVTVSDGDSALIRLEDVDPDLVLADVVMPKRSGYELCHYVKLSPQHRHVRVLLTAGAQEQVEEAEIARCRPDGLLRKPFEASVLLHKVKPLVEAARRQRPHAPAPARSASPASAAPFVAVVDAEQIRAAVTVALDAALPALIDEFTARLQAALARGPRPPAPAPQPEAPDTDA